MIISPSSILTCNFFILPACVFMFFLYIRKRDFSPKDVGFLYLCCLLLLLRLAVPVEFFFTKTIPSDKVLPYISRAYYHTVSVNGRSVYMADLCALVWIGGAVIKSICLFLKELHFKRTLKLAKPYPSECVNPLVDEIQAGYSHPVQFQFYRLPEKCSPFITGLFHPTFYIPPVEFSPEELKCVLRHEMEHFYHHDLWIRCLTEWICILHWWNPLVYLLRKLLYDFLELRADLESSKSCSETELEVYASCLLKVAGFTAAEKAVPPLGLSKSTPSLLKMRCRFLIESDAGDLRHRTWKKVLLAGMVLIALLFSGAVIFEPFSVPADLWEPGMYVILEDGTPYYLEEPSDPDFFVPFTVSPDQIP